MRRPAPPASQNGLGPVFGDVLARPPSLGDVADIVIREWGDGVRVRGAAAMALRDLYGAPRGAAGPAAKRATAGANLGDEP